MSLVQKKTTIRGNILIIKGQILSLVMSVTSIKEKIVIEGQLIDIIYMQRCFYMKILKAAILFCR